MPRATMTITAWAGVLLIAATPAMAIDEPPRPRVPGVIIEPPRPPQPEEDSPEAPGCPASDRKLELLV